VFAIPTAVIVMRSVSFLSKVWDYKRLKLDSLQLRYSPKRSATWSLDYFISNCRDELENLEELFGYSLKGKVTIYLFPAWRQIAELFGRHVGGVALSKNLAIAIAEDNSPLELVRHELAHLFAHKLSEHAPPLFSEGLAVWCQSTTRGLHVADAAMLIVHAKRFKLSMLLKRSYFFDDQHRYHNYLLAGSFTDFLIKQHGWPTYRRFYRKCDSLFMKSYFKRHFKMSLLDAEKQWRSFSNNGKSEAS
jgi:hypothetical protein